MASTSSATHATPAPHATVPDTLPSAVALFAAHPTTLVILAGIATLGTLRLLHSPSLGVADAVTVAAVAAFWVLQEWCIHKYLLHAPFEWVGSKIHVDHHKQPYHHVSIDSLSIVLPFMAVSAGIFHVLLGEALSLTATAAYYAMGLSYEWVHFLVHTRYVPRCARSDTCVRDRHLLPQVDLWACSAQQPHDAPLASRGLLACVYFAGGRPLDGDGAATEQRAQESYGEGQWTGPANVMVNVLSGVGS